MPNRLSEETADRHARYWIESSQYDLSAADRLFGMGSYVWCLFIGHIALEKILKALWVRRSRSSPPRTHNLLLLAQGIGLSLTEKDQGLLGVITRFNVEARYPDEKLDFYRTCTQEFAGEYLGIIKEFCSRFLAALPS